MRRSRSSHENDEPRAETWTPEQHLIVDQIRREFGSLWGDHDTPEHSVEREQARSTRERVILRFIDAAPPRKVASGAAYRQPYSLALHLRALREAADQGRLRREPPPIHTDASSRTSSPTQRDLGW